VQIASFDSAFLPRAGSPIIVVQTAGRKWKDWVDEFSAESHAVVRCPRCYRWSGKLGPKLMARVPLRGAAGLAVLEVERETRSKVQRIVEVVDARWAK
jgi:hypothetical protein